MRLNARFDAAAEQQIVYLMNTTGHNASHVVREAVAHYYVQVRGAQARPLKFLALAGTGSSGRSDIASNVKAFVGQALDEKFKRATKKPAAK
jgi:hypothetical protein